METTIKERRATLPGLAAVAFILAALLAICAMPANAHAAEGDIAISEENFPDEGFREYLRTAWQLDKDGDGVLSASEIRACKELHPRGVASLEGIKHFTSLESLAVDRSPLLAEIDVSGLTSLKSLNCYENGLTSLKVDGCTSLSRLFCHRNSLTEIDVSSCTSLDVFRCYENQLTELDVSKNTKLTYLDFSRNQLTSIDLSNNTELTMLDLSYNHLTSVDASNTKVSSGAFNGNTYAIEIESGIRTFDLSTLPAGFDPSRTSDWKGGTVSGTTLTVEEGATSVSYGYDMGIGRKAWTSLLVEEGHDPAAPVRENEAASTCIAHGGHDEVVYCDACGEELSRETVTDELADHTPGDPVRENVVHATYESEGSYDEVVYCAVCGEELSRETKAIDRLVKDPVEPSGAGEAKASGDSPKGGDGKLPLTGDSAGIIAAISLAASVLAGLAAVVAARRAGVHRG